MSRPSRPRPAAVSAAKKHRLFFALVPDDAVRRRVQELQRQLAGSGRAVTPANLHVTLAFLGMHEAAVIPDVCDIASRLVFPRCRVVLDCLGQFGDGPAVVAAAAEVVAGVVLAVAGDVLDHHFQYRPVLLLYLQR